MENAIPASAHDRFFAYLIDIVLFGAPVFFLDWFGIQWSSLVTVIFIVYMFTKDALPFLHGRSLGKQAMGIRVISTDTGGPIKYGQSILRQLTLGIPFLGIIEALLVASGRTRFGDRLGGTMVVNAR